MRHPEQRGVIEIVRKVGLESETGPPQESRFGWCEFEISK